MNTLGALRPYPGTPIDNRHVPILIGGETQAVLDLDKVGDGLRVRGDTGEWTSDFTIRPQGDGFRVEGDVGEWTADYSVSSEGDNTRVRGDVGEYTADYLISRL